MNNPIVASIGLVSDTHYQDRLFNLPTDLGNLWGNVDLILHAGDVGDLDVLDLIGKFAPTVAVHGNDESDRARQNLPCQQLVTVLGLRILLWHGHYSDPIEEKANRKGTWGPKLERIAKRGLEVNAQLVVYGHTHVPMVCRYNDMVLINPGALSSGSYFTRQVICSVGRLQLLADGEIEVTHFDVAKNQAWVLGVAQPEEDFDLLAKQYQEWIVEPSLIPVIGALGKIAYEDVRAVVRTVVPLYRNCLSDGPMRREDLVRTISDGDLITPNDKKNILAAISQ